MKLRNLHHLPLISKFLSKLILSFSCVIIYGITIVSDQAISIDCKRSLDNSLPCALLYIRYTNMTENSVVRKPKHWTNVLLFAIIRLGLGVVWLVDCIKPVLLCIILLDIWFIYHMSLFDCYFCNNFAPPFLRKVSSIHGDEASMFTSLTLIYKLFSKSIFSFSCVKIYGITKKTCQALGVHKKQQSQKSVITHKIDLDPNHFIGGLFNSNYHKCKLLYDIMYKFNSSVTYSVNDSLVVGQVSIIW